MKNTAVLLAAVALFFLSFCLTTTILFAADAATTATPPQTAPANTAKHTNPLFESMKSLVGDWVGQSPYGTVYARFRLVSNGSVLIEVMNEGKGEMITMYHADGDSVLMTHYCSQNNQPRMRARKAGTPDGQYDFQLVDVSNLAGPDDLHMVGLVTKIKDQDHFTEEWTLSDQGKKATNLLSYQRRQ